MYVNLKELLILLKIIFFNYNYILLNNIEYFLFFLIGILVLIDICKLLEVEIVIKFMSLWLMVFVEWFWYEVFWELSFIVFIFY